MISKEELTNQYKTKDTDQILAIYEEGLLSETAFEVVESELRSRNIPIPARSKISGTTSETSKQGLSEFLLAHWHGEGQLFTAFWGVWFSGNLILKLITFGIEKLWYATESLSDYDSWFLLIENSLVLLFVIFFSVSLWRCAFNTSNRRYGYGVRIFLVIVLFFYFESLTRIAIGYLL